MPTSSRSAATLTSGPKPGSGPRGRLRTLEELDVERVLPSGEPETVRTLFSWSPPAGFGYWVNASMVRVEPGQYLVLAEGLSSNYFYGVFLGTYLFHHEGYRPKEVLHNYASGAVLGGFGTEYVLASPDRGGATCLPFSWASGNAIFREPVSVSLPLGKLSILRAESSYLLGDGHSNGSTVHSLDSSSCTTCEGSFTLASGRSEPPEFALRTRGGIRTDDGLLAWQAWRPQPVVEVRTFHLNDGVITDLGGGCPPGGVASASCARIGNLQSTTS